MMRVPLAALSRARGRRYSASLVPGTRRLAKKLAAQGHAVGPTTVRHLLKAAGYSLQANRKIREVLGFKEEHNWRRYVKV